jgi:DNA-binding protein H-NS
MNLKSMSIDRLTDLRHRVETALTSKVIDQRRALESELAKLTRMQGAKTLRKNGSGLGLGPVPPKYRNPQNPEETWAGRGLRPKWLTAAIKGGKSPDDFLIRGAVASKKATKPKKARKARK